MTQWSFDERSGGLHPGHHRATSTSRLGRLIVGHSLRPCLGQGAFRRARVGQVRRLASLSILCAVPAPSPRVRSQWGLTAHCGFQHSAWRRGL